MKKFKSTTGKPVRISLIKGGHTTIVPSDNWRVIPEIFHDAAYANRCVSDDMAQKFADVPPADPPADPVDREEAIKAEMRRLKAEHDGDAEMFTNSGAPDANVLSANLDISISAAERNALWAEVSAETGD